MAAQREYDGKRNAACAVLAASGIAGVVYDSIDYLTIFATSATTFVIAASLRSPLRNE